MDDREKSKEELSWELIALKMRLEKLEFVEAERGAAEQELRRSEERFRMAVECLDEGLLITDFDGVVLYVNSRISEMTGYAQDEMIGRPAYELILPSDQWPDLRQRNQQRSEGRSDCHEMEAVRKDGSRFWIESNAMPCGFIVNELVSNALKYAFADGRKGVLFIGLSGESRDSVEMVVRDNGVGLPPGFDCQQST